MDCIRDVLCDERRAGKTGRLFRLDLLVAMLIRWIKRPELCRPKHKIEHDLQAKSQVKQRMRK